MNTKAPPPDWERIKNGIFAGESGGDYDALFGFSNRPGKRWAGTRLTAMTVDQAIAFSDPKGAYGQWVKEELRKSGQSPRIATPMGAYQIVGTTLREAKKELGLSGSELMTPELQDRLGLHIYHKQGTGAWEGYKGPSDQTFSHPSGDATSPYQGVYETTEGVDYDPFVHMGTDAPTPTTILQQVETNQNAPDPYESWWGEIGAHLQSSSITAHAIRWMSEDMVDLEFRVSSVMDAEDLKRYPEQYHDMILASSSQKNWESRLKWIEEDMERQAKLGQGGWSATGAGLVSGILDPIPLAAGFATGGLGFAARAGWAGRAAYGAAVGAGVNAAVDLGSQQIFDDPYADPLMAGLMGAGFGAIGASLARNPATRDLADEAFRAGAIASRGASGALRDTSALTGGAGEVLSATNRSIGAASNPHVMDPLVPLNQTALTQIMDDAVPTAFAAGVRFDNAAQLTGASDPLTRLMGFHWFDDAAGTRGNHVTPFSANTRQIANDRELWGPVRNVGVAARNEWLKEQNVSRLNLFERERLIRQFNEDVFLYRIARHKPDDVHPKIKEASEALSRTADGYADRFSGAGVELARDPNYMPLVSDVNRVAQFDREFGSEAMEQMIEAAIRKHSPSLDPKIRARMAKGYWANIRKGAYGIEDGISLAAHRGDKDGFMQALNDGLPEHMWLNPDEAETIWRAMGGETADAVNSALKSGHMKRRTLLDYTEPFRVKDRNGNERTLRVVDFFEKDWELAMGRYSRKMSGQLAFAETKIHHPVSGELLVDGIRNQGELDKLFNAIRESYRQSGRPLDDYRGEMENAIKTLQFGWNRINGIQHWDANGSFAQWARRLKTLQFARLMSNMGLNQAQETVKLVQLTGFRAAMSQMPSIREMGRSVRAGKVKADELLDELSDMSGIGFDGIGTRQDFRIDDDRLGVTAGSRLGARADAALDRMASFTTHISLFRNIQTFQQRWAMKAITQQVANLSRKARNGDSFDFSKLPKKERDRIANLGIGEDELAKLSRNILDHSAFDGKKITGMNFAKWDPDAVSLYRNFLSRYVDRLVLQNDYGSLAKWMSHPVASMFVQFRSFVFGAWGKSTLWSLNHMDPKVFVLMLGEIAAGAATQAVRMSAQATTDAGREKLLEEDLTPSNLLLKGTARTASASIAPAFIDTVLWMGNQLDMGVEPIFGEARSSGSAHSAFIGSPVVDQGAAALQFGKAVVRNLRDDKDFTQRDVRAGTRALPIPGNFVPLVAGLGALINEMPEK